MRLTLRTLLAYLDDILDPADAQQLGEQIEQSEFASGLVHTIRGVTRKQRLGAPKLSGKGMGLDPNTVAEYLDFTLPADRVPDFEKVCIESDVHLAEVAACHQILALVLGEPADVDPDLRARVHDLKTAIAMPGAPTREQQEHIEATPPTAPAVTPTAPPIDAARPAPEPGRLAAPAIEPIAISAASAGPRIRLVPVLVTLFGTFLIALVVLAIMGPLDSRHPVLGRFFSSTSRDGAIAQVPGDSPAPASASATSRESAVSESKTNETAADTTDTAPKSGDRDAEEPMVPPVDPSDTAAAPPTMPDATSPSVDNGDKPNSPDGATADGQLTGSNPASVPAAGPPKLPQQPDPSSPVAPAMANDAGPDSETGPTPVDGGTVPPAQPPEEPEPKDAGRCMSDQHVVVRHDAVMGGWLRLPALAPLEAGDELLAFPTYRPTLALNPGLQLVMVGPTRLTIGKPGADGVPAVAMQFGRVLVMTAGADGAKLDVQFGTRRGRVAFDTPDSMLALEAEHYLPPGEDPTTFVPYFQLKLHATEGGLKWTESDAPDPVAIDAGQTALVIDRERPVVQPAAGKPKWVDAAGLAPIDREASKQLEPILVPKRPVSLSLQEQVNNRLVEVRALAIRCLGLLDQYQPFVDALNDEDLRSYWSSLYESLRLGLARSPESATAIRNAVERSRGEQGQTMYRILWGYSPQQLADGAAKQLVERLEHPALDVRVLAFQSLMQITQRNHMYRPERDVKRQKRALLAWQNALKAGEIAYKQAPPEMPERAPGPTEPSGAP